MLIFNTIINTIVNTIIKNGTKPEGYDNSDSWMMLQGQGHDTDTQQWSSMVPDNTTQHGGAQTSTNMYQTKHLIPVEVYHLYK